MNRGMMKWQPFAALTDQSKILHEMKEKKYVVEKPELSEDQWMELNEKILTNYYSQDEIRITHYKNGHLYEEVGVIKKIDAVNKVLLLSSNQKIPFHRIINIENK